MKSSSAIFAGLLCLLPSFAARAQTLIASEDFEGADLVGYSTLGGSFALNAADYLERGTNGAPFEFEQPVAGFSGRNFIGLEDIDGAGLADPHWLALNPVAVTGYTRLSVSLLVAAPSLLATRYEPEDCLLVEYSMDGADFVLLGRFVGSAGGGPLRHDSNLDGTGDVSIGPAMQRYTYDLGSATGRSLVVRVRFSSAGSQEELAFDDIRITGTPPIASTCGNGVIEGAEACDDGFTGACGACNAACTGAGTGSTCGDGIACSETEACDDGATDACGPCNATCSGPGTGASCTQGGTCDAGQACDAGSPGSLDDAGLDAGAEEAGTRADDAGPVVPDTGTVAEDAGTPVADAGLMVESDACSGDCDGGQHSADAGAVGEGGTCSAECSGAGDAGTDRPDSGVTQEEEEEEEDQDDSGDDGEDEQREQDVDAVEGMVDADIGGSAPGKKRADGCSIAATGRSSAEPPLLLVLGTLLAVSIRRRFARRGVRYPGRLP